MPLRTFNTRISGWVDMAQYVQIRNPKTGKWTLIETERGRICGSSVKPYKGVEKR